MLEKTQDGNDALTLTGESILAISIIEYNEFQKGTDGYTEWSQKHLFFKMLKMFEKNKEFNHLV